MSSQVENRSAVNKLHCLKCFLRDMHRRCRGCAQLPIANQGFNFILWSHRTRQYRICEGTEPCAIMHAQRIYGLYRQLAGSGCILAAIFSPTMPCRQICV